MKEDAGKVVAMTGAAIGINMAHAIRKGNDPFPVFVIGGIYLLLLSAISDFFSPKLATAFAGVFLAGTVVSRFDTVSAVLTGITDGAGRGSGNATTRRQSRSSSSSSSGSHTTTSAASNQSGGTGTTHLVFPGGKGGGGYKNPDPVIAPPTTPLPKGAS